MLTFLPAHPPRSSHAQLLRQRADQALAAAQAAHAGASEAFVNLTSECEALLARTVDAARAAGVPEEQLLALMTAPQSSPAGEDSLADAAKAIPASGDPSPPHVQLAVLQRALKQSVVRLQAATVELDGTQQQLVEKAEKHAHVHKKHDQQAAGGGGNGDEKEGGDGCLSQDDDGSDLEDDEDDEDDDEEQEEGDDTFPAGLSPTVPSIPSPRAANAVPAAAPAAAPASSRISPAALTGLRNQLQGVTDRPVRPRMLGLVGNQSLLGVGAGQDSDSDSDEGDPDSQGQNFY
jgi:hypothetical protein